MFKLIHDATKEVLIIFTTALALILFFTGFCLQSIYVYMCMVYTAIKKHYLPHWLSSKQRSK